MVAIVVYNLNILLAFAILLATFFDSGSDLLERASIENGPYEVATAIVLLGGTLWLLTLAVQHIKSRSNINRWQLAATFAMALLCFVGAGEEISWGQHWLRFESGEFFAQHNHQQETNLHNLIPAVAFSTAINVVIYGGFTLLPLMHWAFPDNAMSRLLQQWGWSGFIPSLDIALMLTLANCFHAWLIPATYSDTAALLACWLLTTVLMILRRVKVSPRQWFMLGLALLGFVLCVLVKDIFRHHNMQYEIRECFTAFVIVYWAVNWARAPQSSN